MIGRLAFTGGPLLLLVIAGCNAVLGFDAAHLDDGGLATDARSDDRSDAAADSRAEAGDGASAVGCDPTKAFAPPTPVDSINSPGATYSAQLSPDELTLYLSSTDRGGGSGILIYAASRPSALDLFATPTPLASVNTATIQVTPSATGDGLTLYFSSQRRALADGGRDDDIFVATRSTTTSGFMSAFAVNAINSVGAETTPFVTPDGTAIYFASTRSGAPALYRSSIMGGGGGIFGAPQAVTELNSGSGNENSPVVTPDELTIFFSSRRANGVGSADIWLARRPSRTVPYDTPTNVTELNASGNDAPSWISSDGCRIYFTSDRPGAMMNGIVSVWQSSRPK